jgi:HlyD family secretion protein
MATEFTKTSHISSGTVFSPINAFNWLKSYATGEKRYIFAFAGMVLVVAAGFLFHSQQSTASTYLTAKVERGNLRNTVTATGTLQAVTTVQVGSQASGTISALFADFNSKVKKGQVIAQLDPSTLRAQVDQAKANLEQARASLVQARAGVANSRAGVSDAQAKKLAAQSTVQGQSAGVSGAQANLAVLKAQSDDALAYLKQQDYLLKSGVIAQRDYDLANTAYKAAVARYDQAAAQVNQAVVSQQSAAGSGMAQSQAQLQQSQAQVQSSQAQVQQAQAQVQQAQAALSLAEINLTHTTIQSPIDGIVVSRDVDVGQTVAASLSAPTLFTIANNLTEMQVIANIDQADIGLVETAKGVQFTVDAFPADNFTGKIQQIRINPVNTQNVVTYNVVIDVSNPEEKLKPGMTTNLIFTIDERNNVLKVPNAALRFRPQDASATSGSNGQGARQGRQRAADAGGNAAGSSSPQTNGQANGSGSTQQNNQSNFAPASAPVLPGQTRVVWVLGADGKPQSRRIKIGLTDGVSTEVVEGNLQEGELAITSETLSAASKSTTTQTAPGFGGGQRTPGAGGGGRRP